MFAAFFYAYFVVHSVSSPGARLESMPFSHPRHLSISFIPCFIVGAGYTSDPSCIIGLLALISLANVFSLWLHLGLAIISSRITNLFSWHNFQVVYFPE